MSTMGCAFTLPPPFLTTSARELIIPGSGTRIRCRRLNENCVEVWGEAWSGKEEGWREIPKSYSVISRQVWAAVGQLLSGDGRCYVEQEDEEPE